MESKQAICKQIGATGCYFLSIVGAAERDTKKWIDIIILYLECLRRGWIGVDCYVNNPEKILGYLVGGEWTCTKDPKGYKPKPGEVVILRYERPTTMQTDGHFVLADKDGNIEYDPLGSSLTVQNGKVASCRVFRRVS